MMLGTRTAAWSKAGPTAKDYVQDGLIAMWDGIENAGWGVHDPNATTWKDLSQSQKDIQVSGTWSEDSFRFSNSGVVIKPEIIGIMEEATVEIVAHNLSSGDNVNPAINFSNSTPFGVIGGHRYSTTGGSATRLGSIISNCIIGYIGTASVPYDSPLTFQSSMIYDKNVKTNNKTYFNGKYLSYFNYANDTRFDGSFRLWISGMFPTLFKNLRFYQRHLTDAEIAANYSIDKARFNIP